MKKVKRNRKAVPTNGRRSAFLLGLICLSACQSAKPILYSNNGYFITLRNDSTFRYRHLLDIGHQQLTILMRGTYSQHKDTLFFRATVSNSDSLYLQGKKIAYHPPQFFIKVDRGLLMNFSKQPAAFLQQN